MSTLSVISSCRLCGSRPLLASTVSTSSTKLARANSFDGTFTDSCSGRPNICCHAAT